MNRRNIALTASFAVLLAISTVAVLCITIIPSKLSSTSKHQFIKLKNPIEADNELTKASEPFVKYFEIRGTTVLCNGEDMIPCDFRKGISQNMIDEDYVEKSLIAVKCLGDELTNYSDGIPGDFQNTYDTVMKAKAKEHPEDSKQYLIAVLTQLLLDYADMMEKYDALAFSRIPVDSNDSPFIVNSKETGSDDIDWTREEMEKHFDWMK